MRAKVAVASLMIAVLLVGGGVFFAGAGGEGGFGNGVRNSEQCKANPDNWWCRLWGAK